jgi:hypothetical protein
MVKQRAPSKARENLVRAFIVKYFVFQSETIKKRAYWGCV